MAALTRPDGARVEIPDEQFRFWKNTIKVRQSIERRMQGTELAGNEHLFEELDKLILDHVGFIRAGKGPAHERPMLAYIEALELSAVLSDVQILLLKRMQDSMALIDRYNALPKDDRKEVRPLLVKRGFM